MLRKSFVILLLCVTAVFTPGVANASAAPGNRDRVLKVMTRNMDLGSDFWYVLAAIKSGDPDALLPAITNTYLEILASRMDDRAAGVADEIQANLPDLIGLQEVSVLSTGPYQAAPTNVVASNLNALLIALQMRGLHYAIVAVQQNAQVVVPA